MNDNNNIFVVLDVENGGFWNATNKTEQSIPVGVFGFQHYPLLELAVKFLDANLNEIHAPVRLVFRQTKESLDKCSQWSKDHFSNTLFKECLDDEIGISYFDADNFLSSILINIGYHKISDGRSNVIFVGNSHYTDRAYLLNYLPKFENMLHYRQLDVSSLNVFIKSFLKNDFEFKKELRHEAFSDIEECISELKYYISNFKI